MKYLNPSPCRAKYHYGYNGLYAPRYDGGENAKDAGNLAAMEAHVLPEGLAKPGALVNIRVRFEDQIFPSQNAALRGIR